MVVLHANRWWVLDAKLNGGGFDANTQLADFDWRFNPKLPGAACFKLHTLKFVAEGQNALTIGRPGTGKSTSPRRWPIKQPSGHNVRYLEADGAFTTYGLSSDIEQRQQLRTLVDADLLVLDDLFLARRISDKAGELLQALVHQRYKFKCSIVVTSYRVVQDWGKYLGDNTMVTTILDWLMHRVPILEFEGKSYRLKEPASQLTR